MKRLWTTLYVTAAVNLTAFAAIAGSARTPPGGDQGGSGSEPAMIALMLFSLIPGIYFARRAMQAQAQAAQTVRVDR